MVRGGPCILTKGLSKNTLHPQTGTWGTRAPAVPRKPLVLFSRNRFSRSTLATGSDAGPPKIRSVLWLCNVSLPTCNWTQARCQSESTKQAPRLTEFEGGRLPSTDTKIQAQLRDKIKSVELGRKKERRRPVEGNKGWPMWPALSLEHIAADEAKVWGKRGHHVNVLIRFAGPRGTWCICIYVQVSNLGQNRLSE